MPREKPLAFVLMPFDDVMKPIYTDMIRPALTAAGYDVRRADDLGTQQNIMRDVVSSIEHAHLVVGDLTGRNPNVMYEVALAHGLGRPTVLIAQHTSDIPFDLRAYRTIVYDHEDASTFKADLERLGRQQLAGLIAFGTPLTDFGSGKAPALPRSELQRWVERAKETGRAMIRSMEELTRRDAALGRRLNEFRELGHVEEEDVHKLCRDMDDYVADQRAEVTTFLRESSQYYAAVQIVVAGVDISIDYERETVRRFAGTLRETLSRTDELREPLRLWRDQHLDLTGKHPRLDRSVDSARRIQDEELSAISVSDAGAAATLRLIEQRLDL